jgi:ATP-dependent RNA helicase DeaD
MPPEIKTIINKYMSPGAFRIETDRLNVMNKGIEHQYLLCDKDEKTGLLMRFLKTQGDNRGIIFCRTKAEAQALSVQLTEKKMAVNAIHGDLMQKERDKVMRAFKNKKLKILIATDLAARGIDVADLSYVVHYQLPDQVQYYTHRSGRTARAGNTGLSLSLISATELLTLKTIASELGFSLRQVPR